MHEPTPVLLSLTICFAGALLLTNCSSSSDGGMFSDGGGGGGGGGGADPACRDDTGNRFVDCGNGTVTDTQTGLIWLKNADCFGRQNWDTAMASAAALAAGQCGLTDNSSPGEWRLPDLLCPGDRCDFFQGATGAFATIYRPGCQFPNGIATVPNTRGDGCWVEGDPFTSVQPLQYWSCTSKVGEPDRAWYAGLGAAAPVGAFPWTKSGGNYVWPVRGGP